MKQFKGHIASSVEIPVDKQRLIYQGRVLQDDRTLTEYSEYTHTHTQPGEEGFYSRTVHRYSLEIFIFYSSIYIYFITLVNSYVFTYRM